MPQAKKESKNKEPEKVYGNSFGITSLVLGILSLVFMRIIPPLGILLGFFGIIFGAVQQKRTPTGIATAGLITSIIGLIISIITTVLMVVAFFIVKDLVINSLADLKEVFGGLPINELKDLQELKDLLSQMPTNISH